MRFLVMQLSFKKKEKSMKRKLFVYMFFLVTAISITILMGLFLFGRLGTTEQDFMKNYPFKVNTSQRIWNPIGMILPL